MIYWLIQTNQQISLNASETMLHEQERVKFGSLGHEKRQQDWLLGRWTAKRLLQKVIWDADEVEVPLNAIQIGNNADGVPIIHSPLSILNSQLSISHSNGRSLAAAITNPNWPIGADLELVKSRGEQFVDDYFTGDEVGFVRRFDGELRDVMETAVWSAKEAVLKALHLGLSVDTRSIQCLPESYNEPSANWQPFAIQCDQMRLGQTWIGQNIVHLKGWWHYLDGFVVAMASLHFNEPK